MPARLPLLHSAACPALHQPSLTRPLICASMTHAVLLSARRLPQHSAVITLHATCRCTCEELLGVFVPSAIAIAMFR